MCIRDRTTAERMCYIVNDKDLSQQAKEYFAQIRKTDRLIHRLDSTIATLRSSLTSTGSQLKQDKVQTSGPKLSLIHILWRKPLMETWNMRWTTMIPASIPSPLKKFSRLKTDTNFFTMEVSFRTRTVFESSLSNRGESPGVAPSESLPVAGLIRRKR